MTDLSTSSSNTTSASPAPSPAPAPATGGGVAQQPDGMTRDQAQAEIDRLKADPVFRADLLRPMNAGHKHAMRTWDRLHALANGSADPGEQQGEQPANQPGEAPPGPADYRISEEVPAGAEFDAELASEFRGWAHTLGMDQAGVDFATRLWNQAAAKPPTDEQIEQQTEQTERILKQRYGDQYEAKIATAKAVLARLPAAQHSRVMGLLRAAGLGSSLPLIERLIIMGERQAR